MSLVCAQCSRVNPDEAAYCYYDGAALAGRAGGPINAGSAPFPSQFVFPNGLQCRNFDQLAMACQEHWPAALDLLKQGYLGSFFGGMGRIDLALAAQEAAKFPDLDRGLDQLISKLPTQALQPPKLQAEPSEVNLGQVKIGEDRSTELHLANVGMRLLYGTVTSDCKWLTIGEGAGHPEKMFQFGADTNIPVHVRGQHLRAGNKPSEGHLTIDSNGGTITVTFKADVPITPFEGAMFKGAVTPRQIAEAAKKNPKEATPLFEKGDIAKWYAANGWPYPVQGPTMPGMGAIQQFFEALGVAKAPKVEVNPKSLDLQGAVGKTVNASLEVVEPAGKDRRKFVYGWATSDQPWLEVGKSKLTGKSAVIPITVRIPSPCPPTLEATLNVVGNGSQKLTVPVKVTVAGGKAGVVLKRPEDEIVNLEIIGNTPAPLPVHVVNEPMSVPVVSAPLSVDVVPDTPTMVGATTPTIEAAITSNPFPSTADQDLFALPGAGAGPGRVETVVAPSSAKKSSPFLMRLLIHLIPMALLFMCLFSMLMRDVYQVLRGNPPPNEQKRTETSTELDIGEVDPRPFVRVQFDEGKSKDSTDSMNFGVHALNPNKVDSGSVKLNYYDNGLGNSIVAKINDKEKIFGKLVVGKWDKGSETAGQSVGRKGTTGKTRTFVFNEGIAVTQTVTVEPGEPGDDGKRPLNTCLIRYKVENRSPNKHKFGLRVLMDTCIGDNDGAPFALPGSTELVDTFKEFSGDKVPDFVQVLEKPDLKDPGIALHLNLRASDKFEPPSRFLLTHYPRDAGKDAKLHEKWDVALVPFKKDKDDVAPDSSVVMYWGEQELKPKEPRELGYTYGLGVMSASATSTLGMTVGGSFQVGGELTIVALVSDKAAKTATLELPKHLSLLDAKLKTQPVAIPRVGADGKQNPGTVSWRVKAIAHGAEPATVSTDTNLKVSRKVTITLKSLFN